MKSKMKVTENVVGMKMSPTQLISQKDFQGSIKKLEDSIPWPWH